MRCPSVHSLEVFLPWQMTMPGSMRSRALVLSRAYRVEELTDFELETVAVA